MIAVDFFEKPEILNKVPKLSKAYIDGNYYFLNFQRNLSFYVNKQPIHTIRTSHECTHYFLDWVSSKFNQCADSVLLVVDSMESRRHADWHCKKFDTYIPINFKTISQYTFMHKNLSAIMCEYDTKQKIIELCRLHPQSNDYTLDNEAIADIGLFSGSNHFLWSFPYKEECIILNIDQRDEITQYSISNNKLMLRSQNITGMSMLMKKCKNKEFIDEKFANDVIVDPALMKLFMQMAGTTLQNDYIKYPLWNQQIFQEAFRHFQKFKTNSPNNRSLFCYFYFDKYVEKFICRKEGENLILNAVKFINFMSTDVFYMFDVTSIKQIAEKNDTSKTINLLFNILTQFCSRELKNKEKNFNSEYRDSFKETVLLRSVIKSYFDTKQLIYNDSDCNEKFFFICTCCLFMMVLNLTMKNFNEHNNNLVGRTAHFYFAKRVWQHVFVKRNLLNQSYYNELFFKFVDDYSKLFFCDKSIEDFIFFKYKNLIFSRPKIKFF